MPATGSSCDHRTGRCAAPLTRTIQQNPAIGRWALCICPVLFAAPGNVWMAWHDWNALARAGAFSQHKKIRPRTERNADAHRREDNYCCFIWCPDHTGRWSGRVFAPDASPAGLASIGKVSRPRAPYGDEWVLTGIQGNSKAGCGGQVPDTPPEARKPRRQERHGWEHG